MWQLIATHTTDVFNGISGYGIAIQEQENNN